MTQELLEKIREVEARVQLQEKIKDLSDWVRLTQQTLSGCTKLSLTEAQVSHDSLLKWGSINT